MRPQASHAESGFTLIELLYTMSIVGILSAMAMASFHVYREDVEYRKAEYDLRNARTALELGDQEAPAGLSVPLTDTDTSGGPVLGALADILPGAVTSPDVLLGAQYQSCENRDPANWTINQLLLSRPCKADRYTSYLKHCNGVEVIQRNLAQGDVC
ncbi:MAG: prepilin-type N-terminal cleavage/methylation domain-containing protein [Bdellovibrionales bacterium]|nr:prepilin-type N-terminal cleavage/methylation domain-containing protein [Bdellovibrionales bacterium]